MRQRTFSSQTESKPSFVPPVIAGILSAVLPGFGQMLAREFRRGFTILLAFVSIIGLAIWRFRLAARRDTGFIDIFLKGLRLEPTLILITIAIVLLYIWIILDAHLVAKQPGSSSLGLLFMVLIVYFGLGWQIGDVNPIKIVTGLGDAKNAVSSVMWPWEAAVTYPESVVEAFAEIAVPCTDDPPPIGELTEGEPSVIVEPACGSLTEVEGKSGSLLHLSGSNFEPGKETKIIWADPILNIFPHREGGEYIKVTTDENGDFELDVIMPYRLVPPSAGERVQTWKVGAQQTTIDTTQPMLSKNFKLVIARMIETIFIGMMATFYGILLAIPFSFLAAQNLMSGSPITMGIYYLVRTILNIVRSIEPLIWAIIFVIIVGLGPFAGILALTVHSIAALGKLYSESIESIDPGPIEAIQATGANWLQIVRFAVIPQIIPPFVSFTIYRWDINIRMSTVIGFVGGGGIGFLLIQWINLLDYKSAGIAVWFIAVTVAILDYVSAEIRKRFV